MKHYDALINLSGGMDSTAALYLWLKENPKKEGKRILVHHCRLKNSERRVEFESMAVEHIMKWFTDNNMDNFDYVESGFDFSHGRFVQDIEVMGFLTGWLLRDKEITVDRVFITASAFDFTLPGYDDRALRRFNVIKALTEPMEVNYDYPIKHLSREEVIKTLPPTLRDKTWFCRRPVINFRTKTGKPCRKCTTCNETIKFLKP